MDYLTSKNIIETNDRIVTIGHRKVISIVLSKSVKKKDKHSFDKNLSNPK